jgi:hypothetical protein
MKTLRRPVNIKVAKPQNLHKLMTSPLKKSKRWNLTKVNF